MVCRKGNWWIEDVGSAGGTYVNDKQVRRTQLAHGDLVALGQTQCRFEIRKTADVPGPAREEEPKTPVGEATPADRSQDTARTQLPVSGADLEQMCAFLDSLRDESHIRTVLTRCLMFLRDRTGAAVAGFLALDETGSFAPRIVVPEGQGFTIQLSRSLTRQVLERRATVRHQVSKETDPESLLAFADAMCIPLVALAGEAESAPLLGALHLYRSDRCFNEREVYVAEIVARHVATHVKLLRLVQQLQAENTRLRVQASSAPELVGSSKAMQELRAAIARAAASPSTVLIHGESGVGKELVVQAMHRQSVRSQGPLVVVNCATIQPALAESILFGCKKGAFTGADADRPGLIHEADGGILFLDEVAELPLECQAKLLRVLEGKPFYRVGGTEPEMVDVRFVAATHRDLESQVACKRFREDLYYRLSVLKIHVPPLREHPEDIAELVEHYLGLICVKVGRTVRLTPRAIAQLQRYSWPGNVRQLINYLESLVITAPGEEIDIDALPSLPTAARQVLPMPSSLRLDALETWAIQRALEQCEGRVSEAARLLGISRDTLYRKMQRHGLTPP